MKPSLALSAKRDAINQAIARSGLLNPRLFGSALHGRDHESSDLDLLVDAPSGTTLLDLCALQDELEDLLGIPVDLHTPMEINQRFRAKVLAEARAL